MPRGWFKIWSPGRVLLRDGRVWEDTPADLVNGYVQGKAMLAAGLWIPGCWEHQPQARPAFIADMADWSPDRRAQFARNTFGHVTDYDLRPGHQLWAELDVPDQKDLDQLRRTRGFSPRLDTDARDPRGRTYPGKSVAHVAATPTPFQTGTGPVPVQLSSKGPPPARHGTADSMLRVWRRQAELAKKFSTPSSRR
jgi:hypothetical protein